MDTKEKKESSSLFAMIMFGTLIVGTIAILLKFLIGF
jgi:hypothetical protein